MRIVEFESLRKLTDIFLNFYGLKKEPTDLVTDKKPLKNNTRRYRYVEVLGWLRLI